MRIPWGYILKSFLPCWAKGNLMLLGIRSKDHDDARFFLYNFGFSSVEMDEANARMKLTDRRWHHWTNYLVDWTHAEGQRACKVFCALIGDLLILAIIGFAT